MNRMREALAWRWRRLSRPLSPVMRVARAVPRLLRERREKAAFELTLGRLAAERASPRGSTAAPLRLLAIGTWTFPEYSQSFVYQELAALAANGFDVRLAASASGPADALAPGVRSLAAAVLFLPGGARTGEAALAWFRSSRPDRVDAILDELAGDARLPRAEIERDPHVLRGFAFARLAEAFDADWIHSYFFYEGALAASIAARLLERPRGFTAYADHALADYRWKRVREQLAEAELIVATSRRARDELAALVPDAAPRILVKPNSVDTAFFAGPGPCPCETEPAAGEPFRLLAVCRVDPKKGLLDLVAASAVLAERRVPFQLDLVGGVADGDRAGEEYEREVEREIERRGLGARIVRRGFRPAEEVRLALHRAHLFVAPYVETASGDKDGIPTALLEAMAAAVPVVATRAGAISEAIVAGENGLLVPPGDPEALAAAIERLLRDRALRGRLAKAGAERARLEFDLAVCEPVLAAAIAGHARDARSRRETGEGAR